MKHIYLLFALAACSFTTNVSAADLEPEVYAEPEMESPADLMFTDEHESIEDEVTGITISVNGSQLRVTGASGQMLEIYNLAGVRVTNVRIDAEDKTMNLNLKKGCYMVKVGKVVRKISIR